MFLQCFPYLLESFFSMQSSRFLGIEKIRVTDDFFFHRNRDHIPPGKGQLLLNNILDADADADMAFACQGMEGQSFCFQNLSAENSVANVRRIPVAENPWSINQ